MPKALVVDDDPTTRTMLEFSLTLEGHEVVTAADGREALTMIRATKPDVVLLDVMMPHLDGFQVLETVRHDPDIQNTPVILLTALARDEDIWTGWKSGICSYISKPLDVAVLQREIKRVTSSSALAVVS